MVGSPEYFDTWSNKISNSMARLSLYEYKNKTDPSPKTPQHTQLNTMSPFPATPCIKEENEGRGLRLTERTPREVRLAPDTVFCALCDVKITFNRKMQQNSVVEVSGGLAAVTEEVGPASPGPVGKVLAGLIRRGRVRRIPKAVEGVSGLILRLPEAESFLLISILELRR